MSRYRFLQGNTISYELISTKLVNVASALYTHELLLSDCPTVLQKCTIVSNALLTPSLSPTLKMVLTNGTIMVQMTITKEVELSKGSLLTSQVWLHTFAVLVMSVCRCARRDRGVLPVFTGAQYISRRRSSQLWKQHSSTMPRLCDRLELGPYPVGLPVGCIGITLRNSLLYGENIWYTYEKRKPSCKSKGRICT